MSTRNVALLGLLARGASRSRSTSRASSVRASAEPRARRSLQADIAAWDISIMPDGTGLPPGSGTRGAGRADLRRRNAPPATAKAAREAPPPRSSAAQPLTNGIETTKTIANFWPYATTLFDFTRRAMPWQQPRTLTNDEVYALTAYILSLNKIIGDQRRDERADAAEGPDAQPGRVHPRFPDKIP